MAAISEEDRVLRRRIFLRILKHRLEAKQFLVGKYGCPFHSEPNTKAVVHMYDGWKVIALCIDCFVQQFDSLPDRDCMLHEYGGEARPDQS